MMFGSRWSTPNTRSFGFAIGILCRPVTTVSTPFSRVGNGDISFGLSQSTPTRRWPSAISPHFYYTRSASGIGRHLRYSPLSLLEIRTIQARGCALRGRVSIKSSWATTIV
ncbi:unnamed protein product [Prunus armeniaca]